MVIKVILKKDTIKQILFLFLLSEGEQAAEKIVGQSQSAKI